MESKINKGLFDLIKEYQSSLKKTRCVDGNKNDNVKIFINKISKDRKYFLRKLTFRNTKQAVSH